MLNEWIGRQERAEDEVTASGARRLAALLDSQAAFRRGDPLPGPWYVMLFNPVVRQSGLGPDGHAAKGQFLPPVPLPRRLFAGRRASLHAQLRIGDEVGRVSTIQSITPKKGRSGEMCFVTVRHEISGPAGLAVVEEQDIVYRGLAKGIPEERKSERPETPRWSRVVTPDETMLFRFSAITFNAHRIHYDLAYTREAEGYPGLIMNGGLTTLLLQELAISSTGRALRSSVSRNLKPMFANRPITLCGAEAGGKVRVWALDDKGDKAVQAELEMGEKA